MSLVLGTLPPRNWTLDGITRGAAWRTVKAFWLCGLVEAQRVSDACKNMTMISFSQCSLQACVRSTSPRSYVLINRCRVATVFACSLRPLQHMGARILEASRHRCVLTKTRLAQPSAFQANQASPSSLDPATQTRQCSWCQIITPMAEVGCPAMQP